MKNWFSKISLAPNWREILKRAWSLKLMLVAGLLSGLEVGLPYINQVIGKFYSVPPGVFAVASIITTAAAFCARLIAQKGITNVQ